jgi:PAS domain S-box-containing protein
VKKKTMTKRQLHLEADKLQTKQDATEQPLPDDGQALKTHIAGHRQAEEDLYQERERLRVTLGSISDAVLASDNAGRITFLNPVAATLTGWQLEDAMGQPIQNVFQIINEKTRAPAEDVVARVLSEKRVIGLANDTMLVARDGREVPIEDSAAPIKDSAGNLIGVVLIFHDVTEKRRAKTELRKSYERADWLARFPEQNPQPVIRVSADGTVLYCNPASLRHRGWICEVGQCLQNELLPLVGRAMAEGKEVQHDIELGERSYLVWVVPFPEERYATIYSRDITERKRAENALRESEQRYRSYIEVTGQLGWFTNADGDVVEDSSSWRKFTGQSEEEVKGWGWSKALHPDDIEHTVQVWKNAIASRKRYETEYRILRYDGVYQHFLARGVPVFKEDGNILEWVGTCVDITERKQIEDALQQSEETSRQRMLEIEALYRSAPVGLCELDRELRWVRINDRLAEINGIPAADCIGRRVRDLMPDLADVIEPGMRRVIETGEPCLDIEIQSQMPAQAGLTRSFLEQWLPVKDDQGNVISLNIVVEETTARKEAEEELRRSREDLDRAQAVGQIGSWRLDVGRNVLTWSDENHRIFGLPKGTPMSYETFLRIIHPDDRQFVDTQWKAALAGKPYDVEHRIVADGQVKWVREKSYLEFDDAGKLLGGFGITQDITAYKNMKSALQQAHTNLERKVVQRTAELQKALSEIKGLKELLEAENIYFRAEIKMKQRFEHIIGQSDAIRYALYRAEQVAPSNTTVLVLGETGTGKELIAAAIHDMSPRRDRSMITVNCAALPGNLIESELFGREKGAFTGADTRQVGRFEIANGSSICLDEIGELPLELQAKLLRVIQHNEFERLGSSQTIKVDVRILATTNRDLEEEIRKGRFRQDLYYRLNVFPITVPPLRQRKDDIPMLVESFVERYSRKSGKKITSIQKETMKALQDYPWPGNVRELESIIERAMILCPGPVLNLADKLDFSSPQLSSAVKTLEESERNQILKILSETRWRIEGKDGAAAILGLHPSTLRSRLHKLGIVRPKG